MSEAPLAQAADYTRLIGETPADVDALLEAASAEVRRYCGWHISPVVADTFVLDGSGSTSMVLPTLNLIDVTAATNGTISLDPLDLEWSASGVVRRAGCWTSRLRGVTVTVSHGFESVPDVVKIVCDLVARSAAVPAGVASQSALSQSVTYVSPMFQDEMSRLAMYRLPRRF